MVGAREEVLIYRLCLVRDKPHLTGESSMGFALSGVGMSQNKKEQGIMKNTLKELKPFILITV